MYIKKIKILVGNITIIYQEILKLKKNFLIIVLVIQLNFVNFIFVIYLLLFFILFFFIMNLFLIVIQFFYLITILHIFTVIVLSFINHLCLIRIRVVFSCQNLRMIGIMFDMLLRSFYVNLVLALKSNLVQGNLLLLALLFHRSLD